jgi:tetratricopeptide (TPR) repeat protein
LGLLFLGVYLLPVSHIVPFGALLAERFLLLPSVGLVLLLLPLLRWVGAGAGARAGLALPIAATLMLALGVRSYARAREWHDAVTLWAPVEAVIKDDSRIYNNLALGYMQRGDAERSMGATRRSLVLVPDNRIALSNLGEVLMATGRMDEARTSYERTIQLWPDYPVARYNLAVLDLRGGYVTGARNALLGALRVDPNYAAAQALLAQADPLLARARSFLAHSRAGAETSSDPALLGQVAAACRAIDDGACEASFRARASALPRAL